MNLRTTVYNLRVADCHTYFVSADHSSPAVLVHNASSWSPLTWGWVQKAMNNDVEGFIANLPRAYVETAASGEQVSSASGYTDALTDKLLFGYGTRLGSQYGQDSAYQSGHTVGSVAGFAENAAITISGVGGIIKGVQTVAAAGGMLQIGTAALSTGETIPVIMVNGQAVAATAETLAAAGMSAGGIANLMKGASTSGGGGAEKMQAARNAGRAGEEAAGINGPKTGVEGPISGKMRFPDDLTKELLQESKNVIYQGWTSQLKDYAAIAEARGLDFILWVRESTIQSRLLQAAEEAGQVIIRFFEGL